MSTRTVILVLFALTTAACSSSRAEQCTQLVAKVNAASADASKGGSGGGSNGELASMAKDIDKAKLAVAKVSLDDDTLEKVQLDYVAMLAKISAAAKRMQSASDANDTVALAAGLAEIRAASTDEGAIVRRLDAYCSASER